MKTKKPLKGEKLLKTAVNLILKHPETWDQRTWHSHCGSKHCIAGHMQILAGKKANENTAASDAAKALGITHSESAYLFSPNRSLLEIYQFAEKFSAPTATKKLKPFVI